ncbi:surfactant protein Bb isoform 1-T1 [Synchiropus picturatus]
MSCSAAVFLLIGSIFLSPGDSRFIFNPAEQNICAECRQILGMSPNLISSRDAKESVYEALQALCHYLPPPDVSKCESNVKLFLPKLLMQTHLKSEDTCATFGLCPAENKREVLEVPLEEITSLSQQSSSHQQYNPACSLCLFVIKKLETLLPQNMTEETLMKLMGEVCELIPASYKDQCDDFVDKYGVQIVEFLLSSAAPHTICTLLHICLFKDAGAPEASVPSDCEFCRTLAVLSRIHLSPNSSRPQTSLFLRSVCELHPNAIPKCEAFTSLYGSQLLPVLGNQMATQDPCEGANLCVAKKSVEPLGRNPCTWGPSFWCKDVETAQKCRNLAFCEKHVWRKSP